MTVKEDTRVEALKWTGKSLSVLDQRKLPEVICYTDYYDAKGVAEAIRTMQVRGAPAIGIAAAYGVYLSASLNFSADDAKWRERVEKDIVLLAQSRPTAVNLFWALDLMKRQLDMKSADPLPALLKAAVKIHQDDIASNHKMSELGAAVLENARGVLTHCNAGALATGGYGTALGVIRSAWKKGLKHVFATETRPWLQGARLTIWELQQDGIPATLIADSAAASLMRAGKIDWIVVGADRIAANGDVANKIGTYSLAVLARQHQVKMMVVAPMSTIDWRTENGRMIEIEERNQAELLPECFREKGSIVRAWNPVFDITPAEFVTAIVTECGVVLNPAEKGIESLKNE
ncbi:MAG: S-methyl-5-thioribose-1-phosphate isomerase [Gammaproteobacteria bacterium]